MVYLTLALGFIALIFGGDFLVRGSVSLAKRLGVSPLLIGLTLVGFGTSTPELVTSLLAALQGASDIAVGNIVGSNIANILLVLGVAALIRPVQVDITAFKRDGAFLTISTVLLLVTAALGHINRWMGGVLAVSLIVYVCYSYISDKKSQSAQPTESDTTTQNTWISLIQTIGGICLTIFGAKLLVSSAIDIAKAWHVSEAVIGLTIVAVGTSLPELITSIVSSLRRQNDVAFGNVVGSNIYNILFILGTTALILPIHIAPKINTDIFIMTGVTVSLIGIALWRRRFSRLTGVCFLAAYVFYTYYLFRGTP